MKFHISSEDRLRLSGLAIFEESYSGRFASEGIPVLFDSGRDRPGFAIASEREGYRISYSRSCDAYRALGLLLAGRGELVQECSHESVGVMWDLSRNAVLRVEAWKELLQKFALMGVNTVQLYMEDVYEIPGEPFFGYARGLYSEDELQQIERFGDRLGIEIIPCVQTLGHLEQVLQWPEYRDLTDVPGVLIVGEERTRELIGRMLDRLAGIFRSRSIHIGMDEAMGIGTGRRLQKYGCERPFDILLRHLEMVVAMCRERGLKPMMWSDMFFRIGSTNHDYYDREAVIPDHVRAAIPSDVELVYWDYYHADSAFYAEWIERHRRLGKEPIFAGGAWNWGRFWAYAPRWKENLAAGMGAAKTQQLNRTLLTVWGDDGNECHPASLLPAVQYYAEWAYAGEPDEGGLDRQFEVICPGASRSDYLDASELDEVPVVRGLPECTVNYSKWILWHDPILGFLNAHVSGDLPGHYRNVAGKLTGAGEDEAIQFAKEMALAVSLKSEIHLTVRPAYKAGDLNALRRISEEILPQCIEAVQAVWRSHHAVWMKWNKPFGWEVIECRYAGCVARLERLGALLKEREQNPNAVISEWEFDPLPINSAREQCYFDHRRAKSSSATS